MEISTGRINSIIGYVTLFMILYTSDALAYELSSRWLGDRVSFNPSAQQTCRANIEEGNRLSQVSFLIQLIKEGRSYCGS